MAKKPRFYAVVHGRQTGIFDKWDDGARLAINHFPGADHRAFRSLALAEEWYRQNTRHPHSLHSPIYHFDTEMIAKAPGDVALKAALNGERSKRIIVYAIIDPETEEPFYVGETRHFPRRQQAHLRTANARTKRAAAKVPQILAKNQMPAFKAIEFCESKEAALAAETRWIKHYVERGYTLWNRLREHTEIKELHRAPKIQMDMIIGDGPFLLGPHHYHSRFDQDQVAHLSITVTLRFAGSSYSGRKAQVDMGYDSTGFTCGAVLGRAWRTHTPASSGAGGWSYRRF
ncbi:Predicted double-stranded RNA/RNA-DNA hybrid binding protein [Pseudomonas fluorescens]|uniref:Predicted double-stranded RNA/RNA-DNA hybrid binding protein n=1 Tax=Pseudomonas fluorescens TaxID=294 RepID=A0A3S4QMX5_PSEFL|nr:viroplasmin family protein [Pseudomonas fluorescens]VEF10871.1 Predicted double-stranded RNA/RNA-DNA hybrid binding protein [Pseudomonas fluorescens]